MAPWYLFDSIMKKLATPLKIINKRLGKKKTLFDCWNRFLFKALIIHILLGLWQNLVV